MVYKFLGDIHGKFPVCRKHYDELEDGEVLIQVGDFGFNDTYQSILPFTDANKLQIVAGNHDEYGAIEFWPHYLGDFGILPATRKKVMFCRGAYSIDKASRSPYYDWWPEEELTIPKFDEFLGQYEKFKPHVMVTHDVPADVIGKYCLNIFGASRTEQYLQEAFDIHKPEMWIHGHFHLSMKHIYKRCKFVSLGVNELFKIDL